MSTLEVNTINPQSGTTITIGGSGDTVTLGSGATQSGFGANTPSFLVYRGSAQSIAHNTAVVLQHTGKHYDTHNAYDLATYRFTVPSGHAGKYYLYANNGLENTAPSRMLLRIKLNGTTDICAVETGNDGPFSNIFVASTRDLSVGDYCDVIFYHDKGSANDTTFGLDRFYFGGYKLIGA